MEKGHTIMAFGGLLMATLFCAGSGAYAAEEQSGKTQELRFSVISDIHIQGENGHSQQKLKQALTDLWQAAPDADAMVVNGDLGNGRPADYDALRKLMGKLPHPRNTFYTIGNHEYYRAFYDERGNWNPASFPNGETERQSKQRFLDFAGRQSVYGDAWVKGYHFVFLGSEAFRQSDPAYSDDAWLSDGQLKWLDRALAEKERPERPLFVFLHQPIPNTVAGSRTPQYKRAVIQHERLTRILSRHPQVIAFSGHTHWQLKTPGTFVRGAFATVNSSSVSEPFSDMDEPSDPGGKQSEGLVVEAYPGRVIIRGRDFSGKRWIPEAQFEVRTEAGDKHNAQRKT